MKRYHVGLQNRSSGFKSLRACLFCGNSVVASARHVANVKVGFRLPVAALVMSLVWTAFNF